MGDVLPPDLVQLRSTLIIRALVLGVVFPGGTWFQYAFQISLELLAPLGDHGL